MAKPHLYSVWNVITNVYVSSSSHYWWTLVIGWEEISRRRIEYCPSFGIESWSRAPKYLIREIELRIAEGIRNNTFRFYEHDRDGNRRFTELRYHDPEYTTWLAGRIEKTYAAAQMTL